MANVKISELTALTTAAAADVIAIVDDSATETKKITACCFVTQAFEDFTVGDDLCFSSVGAAINFNSGDVTITHASNVLTFDGGVLSIDDTTDTSSTVTGSIHTDGGVGIAKALWVGTTSCFVGTTTHAGVLSIDNTTNSTTTTSGSIHTDGGLGVACNVVMGGCVGIGGTPSYHIHSILTGTGYQNNIVIDNAQAAAADVGSAIVFVGHTGGQNMATIRSSWIAGANTNARLQFRTRQSGTETTTMTLDENGFVGIGTTAPGNTFTVLSTTAADYAARIGHTAADGNGLIITAGVDSGDFALRVMNCAGATDLLTVRGSGGVGIGTAVPNTVLQVEGDTSISNGYGLMIGHTSQVVSGGVTAELQEHGTGGDDSSFSLGRWSGNAYAPSIRFIKSRGAIGAFDIITSGDSLGIIDAYGTDGVDADTLSSRIELDTEGTIGTGRVPGVIRFFTGTDAAPTVLTEAMTIDSSQNVGIGTDDPNESLTVEAGVVSIKEVATPTATTNYGKVYTKTDNKLYFQDGAGSEHELAFA